MIQIPSTPSLQPTAVGMPSLDDATAAAPLRGLGALAQGIGSLGGAFEGIAMKTQQIENSRMENDARNKLATDYADFQVELQKEQDPAQRIAKTKAFLANAQTSAITPEMPPAVRDAISLHASSFAAHATIAAGADAAALAEKRADQSAQNAIEIGLNQGSPAAVHAAIDTMAAYKTPEEMEAIRRKADYHLAYQGQQKAILADPMAAQAVVDDPDFLKKNPALTPDAQMALQREAKIRVREKTLDTISAIHDGIALGYITDPAQITDPKNPNFVGYGLSPAVAAELAREVVKNHDALELARRATPEYQDLAVGKISGLIANYNPVANGYDLPFTQIQGMIQTLPKDSPVRAELEKNLKDAQSGQLHDRSTLQKMALGSIDDAAKAGHFGPGFGSTIGTGGEDGAATGAKIQPGESKYEVKRFIADGWLRNPVKTGALGYGDAQANLIADPNQFAKDYPSADKQTVALTALGMDPASAGLFAKKMSVKNFEANDELRKELYQTLWPKRKNPGQVTAGPFDQALGNAIHDEVPTLKWLDPEAQDQAITAQMQTEQAVGKAKTEMLNFFQAAEKAGHKVSPEEVAAQLQGLAGQGPRQAFQRSVFEAPPPPASAAAPTAALAPGADNLTDMVKGFEGFAPVAKWDNEQYSIGYGTVGKAGQTITPEEADKRLQEELDQSRTRVEAAAARYHLGLLPHQVDALTSFDYNTGALEQLLGHGHRSLAEIAAAMPLYRNANGQRSPGLETRRAVEQAVFLNGFHSRGGGGGGKGLRGLPAAIDQATTTIPVGGP